MGEKTAPCKTQLPKSQQLIAVAPRESNESKPPVNYARLWCKLGIDKKAMIREMDS